jgi:hypothetical protein
MVLHQCEVWTVAELEEALGEATNATHRKDLLEEQLMIIVVGGGFSEWHIQCKTTAGVNNHTMCECRKKPCEFQNYLEHLTHHTKEAIAAMGVVVTVDDKGNEKRSVANWPELPPIPACCIRCKLPVMSLDTTTSSVPEFEEKYKAMAAKLVESGKVTADMVLLKNRTCPPINQTLVGRRIEIEYIINSKIGSRWHLFPFTGEILKVNVVEAELPAVETLLPRRAAVAKANKTTSKKTKRRAKKKKQSVPVAMLFIKFEEKDEDGKFAGWEEPGWNELHVEYYGKNIHSGWYLEDTSVDEEVEELEIANDVLDKMQEMKIQADLTLRMKSVC